PLERDPIVGCKSAIRLPAVEEFHADSRQAIQWAGKPVFSIRRRQMPGQASRRITAHRTPASPSAGVTRPREIRATAALRDLDRGAATRLLRPAGGVREAALAERRAPRPSDPGQS